MGIRLKDLSKLGYRDNVARSLVVDIVSKHCKYDTKEQIEMTLSDILEHPESYKNNEIWNKLAERLSPTIIAKEFIAYDLLDEPLRYKTYGGKFIETLAKQQMNLAMRLPVTVAGALMPDAHAGYGLPIGGVLATDNVVIPYAVGVDIGCRMSLTIFDASADFLKRCTYQMKEALKDFTHFGMDGGLGFEQEHEVLDREEFRLTPLLRDLHGKAVRQLGSSGGGNHFVEFGEITLQEKNVLNLPEGSYLALLSHSGSRGLGAAIAKHYSLLAHEVLDREEFRLTPLLRDLHGKAVRQLGSSGGGNHFVEFGEIALQENNVLNLPEGNYLALLSHSGSRGLGAAIAKHYSLLAREVCRLPREAQHFAWLDLNTEAGQEYWMSMNLAGDYARACHERIHLNLAKALGLKPLANVNNHHNFAWREEIVPGRMAIVHRKGATPAQKGQAGLIPGSMATAGYLVCGKGMEAALNSASHGGGRAMSRQKAKDSFTQSSLKKLLSQAGVTLIGGSVEEMPLAYKDIDRVMYTQETLVEVQGKFMPRIVRMNKE